VTERGRPARSSITPLTVRRPRDGKLIASSPATRSGRVSGGQHQDHRRMLALGQQSAEPGETVLTAELERRRLGGE